MQLRRFLIGRIASNRPPDGESRLLGFATQNSSSFLEENPEGKNEQGSNDPIERIRRGLHEEALEEVPEAVEGLDTALESEEVFQELLDRAGDAEEALREMLVSAGLSPSMNLADIDPGTLTPIQRHTIAREILRGRPELTIHLANVLTNSYEQREEMLRSIEYQMKMAFGKRMVLQEQKKHKRILSGKPTETIFVIEQQLKSKQQETMKVIALLQKGADVDERLIARELGLDSEHLSPAHQALLEYFKELAKLLRQGWGWKSLAGARKWRELLKLKKQTPSDADFSAERDTYLKDLLDQIEALKKYVLIQLKTRATNIDQTYRDTCKAVEAPLHHLELEEANMESLRRNGYSLVAFMNAAERYMYPVMQAGVLPGTERACPKIDNPRFLAHAKTVLGILRDRETGGQQSVENLLKREKAKQHDVEEAAGKIAKRLRRLNGPSITPAHRKKIKDFFRTSGLDFTQLHDRFEPYALSGIDRENALKEHPNFRIFATDPEFDPDLRHGSESILHVLDVVLATLERDPGVFTQGEAERKELEQTAARMPESRVATEIERTRMQMQAVFTGIRQSEYLDHEICKTLRIEHALQLKEYHLEELLGLQKGNGDAVKQPPRTAIAQAQRELQSLEVTKKFLERIEGNIRIESMPPGTNGYFDVETGIIHINEFGNVESATYHEKGHAIQHAFMQSFPNLLLDEFDMLSEHPVAGATETFGSILRSLSTYLSYKQIALPKTPDHEADRRYMSHMLNELLARYAEWKKFPDNFKFASAEGARERVLFDKLDANRNMESGVPLVHTDRIKECDPKRQYSMAEHDPMTGEREGQVVLSQASAVGESQQKLNIGSEFVEIRRNIEFIKSFMEAYPETQQTLGDRAREMGETYKKLMDTYLTPKRDDACPEEDPQFLDEFVVLKNWTAAVKKRIQDIDVENLDISKAEKARRPGFFDNIRMLSILDVMKLWKDTMEDFQSIYKRRQDRTLKAVGATVTDALGIGKHIPYVGEYFAGLRGYHERRYSGTEVEAANKWKEALKYVDSHSILHMIGTTRDRDMVRGGIDLLVERGEMDWNDEGVWGTFQRMSGFQMPVEACKRSDILRDTWIKKMVSEIWHDKEQYHHWRQGNDSHFKSHKAEFTPTVDQLANVQGGLKNELRKQLKLWVEFKKAEQEGKHPSVPDDVKAHLYEETLHYAMRNGKMSMEDKFFYLIQGVRHGILSVDRLRVLAGEGGEILLRFPFIDYFYQNNNTLPELKRLGERLQESKDPYEPGAKTMLFLQLEMAREESFRHRLSKALGRDNIEKIDHEDYPMIIGLIDYSMIDNITGVLSGARYKVTKESVKNSYVGFNTKFKAFGRLADMEMQGKARFTPSDAREMAVSLTSFVHFDNILTRRGWDQANRQWLTENDINNSTAPSSYGMVVKVFRDRAFAFVNALLDRLEAAGFDWKKAGVDRSDFLQKADGGLKIETKTTASDTQKKVFSAAASFQKELERVFSTKEGQSVLKDTLSKQADVTQSPSYLMEEGAKVGEEYITKQKTEQFFHELAAQEKQGAEMIGGHGGH